MRVAWLVKACCYRILSGLVQRPQLVARQSMRHGLCGDSRHVSHPCGVPGRLVGQLFCSCARGDRWRQLRPHSLGIHGGTPTGTEWTMSGNLFLNGNTVDSNAEGDSWMTKTFGTHSRTYALHIDRATGIDGIAADAALKSRAYYTVSGISLGPVRPSSAGAYVERSVYSNGAVRSRVIVIR